MQARIKQSAPVHDAFKAQSSRLPIAGKIRPGIQVLTKAGREQIPNAQSIYDGGVEAGASYEDIEKQLKKANPKFTRSPLTPRNSAYFRCNQSDFNAPGAAETILQTYGEDRGEGLQLYTFPVIFPVDEVKFVFRQQFEAWNSRELQFWSEPGEDGNLNCWQRQEIKPDKSRRRFGGRPVEMVRACDPNDCDMFAGGKCSHHCSLMFYVPGCAGVGLIELPFTSIYAAMGIKQTIEMVQSGLGRIKGVHDGKPIFWINKRLENVSRIDWETGKAQRTDQYIIRLDAIGIDMTSVFMREERLALGLDAPPAERPAEHRAALAAPVVAQPAPTPEYVSIDMAEGESTYVETVIEQDQAPQTNAIKETIKALRAEYFTRADNLGLTVKDFGTWGIEKYGENAFKELETLEQIDADLLLAESTGDVSPFNPEPQYDEEPVLEAEPELEPEPEPEPAPAQEPTAPVARKAKAPF